MPHDNIQIFYVVGLIHPETYQVSILRAYDNEHSAIQSIQSPERFIGRIPIISGKPIFPPGIPNSFQEEESKKYHTFLKEHPQSS
jgi:hypothetical protein